MVVSVKRSPEERVVAENCHYGRREFGCADAGAAVKESRGSREGLQLLQLAERDDDDDVVGEKSKNSASIKRVTGAFPAKSQKSRKCADSR
jgi:hypothetical protein